MARILVRGDDLVVRLSWREKAAARRGSVRVPLAAVRRVTVEPAWWRALRGVVLRGVWIPGVLCVGTRGHPGGQDFVAVRPGRPVVCVELRPTAPFSLLAVSVRDDAEAVAERLRRRTPGGDASVPRRQPLPAAEETENSWRELAKEPHRRRRRPRPASTARRGHAPKPLQVRVADRRPVHGRRGGPHPRRTGSRARSPLVPGALTLTVDTAVLVARPARLRCCPRGDPGAGDRRGGADGTLGKCRRAQGEGRPGTGSSSSVAVRVQSADRPSADA